MQRSVSRLDTGGPVLTISSWVSTDRRSVYPSGVLQYEAEVRPQTKPWTGSVKYEAFHKDISRRLRSVKAPHLFHNLRLFFPAAPIFVYSQLWGSIAAVTPTVLRLEALDLRVDALEDDTNRSYLTS